MAAGQRIKNLVKDFRFWVVLFFLIRLYGITNPPLEKAHNWRQSFTCMVARNFLETSANILYPRIDIDGNHSGIVGCEFPVFNYLIFLVSKIFGYAHWYGRLINLLVSSLGILCFYLIIRKYFGEQTAFYSGLVLLCSLWFCYARKIMPDTFSLSLVLIGVYYATLFIAHNKILPLVLFIIFSALGGLSKMPALIMLSLLVLPLITKQINKRTFLILCCALADTIIIVALWYFYWVPHLVEQYRYQHFFEKDLLTGIKEIIPYRYDALEKFYFGALLSYSAFGVFLFGCYRIFRNKEKNMTIVFVLALLIFLFFAVKTGAVFPTHSYYILPFVPFMALVAGYGLSEIKINYIRIIFIIAIIVESIANQQHDFRIRDDERYLTELEKIADKVSGLNDLIAVSGGEGYQQMYFAHRRGWALGNDRINDHQYLDSIRKNGCKFLFVNKKDFADVLKYEIIFENKNYTVYKL